MICAALVDRAHALGIATLLDVVYNHFGPDGSYLARFSPDYLSDRHRTPWGPAVNFDGPGCDMVRAFFIENAMHWIHEYHLDGLRLDATHSMFDEGPRHFLAELSARVHEQALDRPIHLIAEDHRNLAGMLRPESEGGWGLDGVWSDDFHHQLRRLLCGDDDGVYRDFAGTVADLVTTLNRGWLFTGECSIHRGKNRGTDPAGLPLRDFIFCIQNHDRIGNRAFGERLNHQVDAATFRAASALLLLAPQTPLLFMGQEWAASSPFLFFTDHEPELGRRVRGDDCASSNLIGLFKRRLRSSGFLTRRTRRRFSPRASTGPNATATTTRRPCGCTGVCSCCVEPSRPSLLMSRTSGPLHLTAIPCS